MHGREGADNGHRHRGRGHQKSPEVLQEDHYHDEHEEGRHEKAFHKPWIRHCRTKVVVSKWMRVFQAFGELPAHLFHGLVNTVGDGDGICLGQGEDDDLGRPEPVDIRIVRVGLLPEIHPGHVADAHDLGARPGVALHDDVFELVRVGEPAQAIDGELEDLFRRHRAARPAGPAPPARSGRRWRSARPWW